MELGNNRTLAQLRAFTVKDVHLNYSITLSDTGKEGIFRYDSTDTTSTDNTGTIVVTASGARYKRVAHEEVLSSWFDNTNTGFQNFVNACAGRMGVINNSFTLTTNISMPGNCIMRQRNGITVSTNASVGFTWYRQKHFIGQNLYWIHTGTTSNHTLMLLDGLWEGTFDTCKFTISSTNVDFVQMKAGVYVPTSDIWGTYFNVFNNCRFEGGRYVIKADGENPVSHITNNTLNFCWTSGGVSVAKMTRANNFNFHRFTADSLTGDAFDFDYVTDCIIEPNELTPGGGFVSLKETSTCHKNVVNYASRVSDFTTNTSEFLGWDGAKLTLQGSNSNADYFRTRLNSVFSYNGSTLLQAKGGTNVWTDILLWSETKGLELRAGWSNWLRLKEARISKGANDQIKTYVKTMTATSSQFQDLIYFSTPSANESLTADITVHYKSTDNTVAVIQKILFVQTCNTSNVVNYSMAVTDALIVGTTTIPIINTFYPGSLGTVAITHANVALAATMDIEIKYSSTTNATLS